MTSTKPKRAVRIGIGGPVGSGKTMLVLRSANGCAMNSPSPSDQVTLHPRRPGSSCTTPSRRPRIGSRPGLPTHRDPRRHLHESRAIAELELRHPDAQLILVESGGDNLSATFSPRACRVVIYVIDVAEGQDPAQRRPRHPTADLLLINKIELAPYVGADLA